MFIVVTLITTAKLPTLSTAASNFEDKATFKSINERNHWVNFTSKLLSNIPSETNPNPVKTIVIDPGHGGRDPGGVGSKTQEKDIVLSVSLILEELLNKYFPDIEVILTRDSDVFIPLHERAEIANKAKADLFISLHCNIAPNKSQVMGSETFVLGLHRAKENLEVAKRENAVITLEDDYEQNYGGYDPNSPEGHIIISAYQNAYLGHSIRFASLVEQEFQTTAKRKSRGVKQAGFLVLRQTTMPSVLVEAGFLSNSQEEAYLNSLVGQRQISLSLLRAIQQYLRDWGYEPVAVEKQPTQQNSKSQTPLANTENNEPESEVSAPDNTVSSQNDEKKENSFYTVQLMTTSSPIDLSEHQKISGQEFFSLSEDGKFRLLNGVFSDYHTAAKHRAVLKNQGYEDAFIIGVQDQKRIPLAELKSD